MSLPVFLADDVSADRIVLTGPEGHHAARVRRVRTGERIDVVDGRGTRVTCTVGEVGRDSVELTVLARATELTATPRLVLVQALAKGDRGELAVELATEVGVDEIVPWSAERCVVKWDGDRGTKALERWRSTAREAGKQSRRAWLPVVGEQQTTQQVAERIRASAATLVLDAAAGVPIRDVQLPADGDVLLVVGPEGGLSDGELALLTAAGATAVRLGPSVLRTSTAGAVAAAVVSARTSRWC